MEIPPSDSTIIKWNGFLETIIKPSRNMQESCAWIFVDMKTDIWNILEVKNIGLKDMTVRHSFAPDKKEFMKAKRKAKKNGWTRIGCIHTHVVVTETEAEYQFRPSDLDLKYARKCNDIIRGIIVVQYADSKTKGKIYGMLWTDQHGNILWKEK